MTRIVRLGVGLLSVFWSTAALQAAEPETPQNADERVQVAQGGDRSRGAYGFPDWDSRGGNYDRSRWSDRSDDRRPGAWRLRSGDETELAELIERFLRDRGYLERGRDGMRLDVGRMIDDFRRMREDFRRGEQPRETARGEDDDWLRYARWYMEQRGDDRRKDDKRKDDKRKDDWRESRFEPFRFGGAPWMREEPRGRDDRRTDERGQREPGGPPPWAAAWRDAGRSSSYSWRGRESDRRPGGWRDSGRSSELRGRIEAAMRRVADRLRSMRGGDRGRWDSWRPSRGGSPGRSAGRGGWVRSPQGPHRGPAAFAHRGFGGRHGAWGGGKHGRRGGFVRGGRGFGGRHGAWGGCKGRRGHSMRGGRGFGGRGGWARMGGPSVRMLARHPGRGRGMFGRGGHPFARFLTQRHGGARWGGFGRHGRWGGGRSFLPARGGCPFRGFGFHRSHGRGMVRGWGMPGGGRWGGWERGWNRGGYRGRTSWYGGGPAMVIRYAGPDHGRYGWDYGWRR